MEMEKAVQKLQNGEDSANRLLLSPISCGGTFAANAIEMTTYNLVGGGTSTR